MSMLDLPDGVISPYVPCIPNRQSPIQTAPAANIHERFIGLMEVISIDEMIEIRR